MTNKQMIGVGVFGVLVGLYVSGRVKRSVAEIGEAVNPVNQDNIFYTGVNAVGEKITGDEHWTLGGQVYDWIH